VRRKSIEVQKAQAGKCPEGEAACFIKLIRALYQFERRLKRELPTERCRQR
jgi:hypothetical protein